VRVSEGRRGWAVTRSAAEPVYDCDTDTTTSLRVRTIPACSRPWVMAPSGSDPRRAWCGGHRDPREV